MDNPVWAQANGYWREDRSIISYYPNNIPSDFTVIFEKFEVEGNKITIRKGEVSRNTGQVGFDTFEITATTCSNGIVEDASAYNALRGPFELYANPYVSKNEDSYVAEANFTQLNVYQREINTFFEVFAGVTGRASDGTFFSGGFTAGFTHGDAIKYTKTDFYATIESEMISNGIIDPCGPGGVTACKAFFEGN